MQFVFEQIRTGGDRNLAYVIGDRTAGEAVIVDPSYAPRDVVARATAQGLRVTHIVNTHGHGDHTNGNRLAQDLTEAPTAALGGSGGTDIALSDGQELRVGAYTTVIRETPGHTQDHIVILVADLDIAITGDLLFVGKVGGTYGDQDAREEWETLQELLRDLPATTSIWPGHDYGCRPCSTLALERLCNPFLQCADFAAFRKLKDEWPSFKARNGLK